MAGILFICVSNVVWIGDVLFPEDRLLALHKSATGDKTATVRTRIEPGLKREVEAMLGRLGLTASETASETLQLLYRQIKLLWSFQELTT